MVVHGKGCRTGHRNTESVLQIIQKEPFEDLFSRGEDFGDFDNFKIYWKPNCKRPSVQILDKKNNELAAIFFDNDTGEIIMFTGNLSHLKDIPGNPFKEFWLVQKDTRHKNQKPFKGIVLAQKFKCHDVNGQPTWKPLKR